MSQKFNTLNRRSFVKQSILCGSGLMILPGIMQASLPKIPGLLLSPSKISGLKNTKGKDWLKDANWYSGENVYDGFQYEFPAGSLSSKKYITADMLAEGTHMVKFQIELQEGASGRIFQFRFGVLNQCALRVRMPLSLVDQNHWGIEREGAFLKPRCSGERVDLSKVDRMKLYISKKSEQTARFCIGPVIATEEEVPLMDHPVLPMGELIDDMGQSAIHEWSGKTRSVDELKANLSRRLENTNHKFPEHFSKMGGWKKRKIKNETGFFTVHKDNERWWLADPEGYLFWSAGIDCVLSDIDAKVHLLEDALTFLPPKHGKYEDIYNKRKGALYVNYLAANFIRAFGKKTWKEKWAKITMDELKRLRFNTVGNWSEWEYASKAGVPYVRPMHFAPKQVEMIYRDFPDVYDSAFEKDAASYAKVLENSVEDSAMIGYFMMNEPTWAFSSELPAVGMLLNAKDSYTRKGLSTYLKKKYPGNADLAEAWNMSMDHNRIASGDFKASLTKEALIDLEGFSEIMVEKYFGILSEACRKVDPNHLNLGIRYASVPPKWAVAGMRSFDVFSMNCYQQKVPFDETREIHDLLQMPVIIGEWHFGSLDAGLPSSGIGHVRSQEDRGKAYRVYLEDAAANPYCVGVHWFTLYDESALGRFDGENYNIGFLDICNQPYDKLCAAAIKSHEKMYELAIGTDQPYNDVPEYLPKLF